VERREAGINLPACSARGEQALEQAADRRLVHTEDAADLREWLAIKKIGGEQVPFFRRKTLQRNRNGTGQASEFRGNGYRLGLRRGSVERIER